MSGPSLLQAIRINGNANGPCLLVTAGVHGDEFEPMAAVRRLAAALRDQRLQGQVILIPVVNQAAFLAGQRTAPDGLDLARTCPGRDDGSITERVAGELSQLIRAADYYVDLHTGGTCLRVLPMTGYLLHADQRVLDVQRSMARAFQLPIVWGTDPSLPGRTLSVARDAAVPAIYAEYGGGGPCDLQGVEALRRGCLNLLAHFEMLDCQRAAPSEQLVVEDSRANSGWLQICHPAARSGFFQPAVQLGEQVEAGNVLGTVVNDVGSAVETVRCQEPGLVLVLRTFARVLAGDSLAVMLPSSGLTDGVQLQRLNTRA